LLSDATDEVDLGRLDNLLKMSAVMHVQQVRTVALSRLDELLDDHGESRRLIHPGEVKRCLTCRPDDMQIHVTYAGGSDCIEKRFARAPYLMIETRHPVLISERLSGRCRSAP
jgi:hypothetical protein